MQSILDCGSTASVVIICKSLLLGWECSSCVLQDCVLQAVSCRLRSYLGYLSGAKEGLSNPVSDRTQFSVQLGSQNRRSYLSLGYTFLGITIVPGQTMTTDHGKNKGLSDQ